MSDYASFPLPLWGRASGVPKKKACLFLGVEVGVGARAPTLCPHPNLPPAGEGGTP